MSYTKREDIPVADGSLAVELDTGEIIVVRCDRKRVDSGVCYHAIAIAAASLALTEIKYTAPVDVVESLGDAAIARECMLLVLGEPLTSAPLGLTLIPWPDTVITGSSIRVSMKAAAVTGPADAGAVL